MAGTFTAGTTTQIKTATISGGQRKYADHKSSSNTSSTPRNNTSTPRSNFSTPRSSSGGSFRGGSSGGGGRSGGGSRGGRG